MDFNNNQNDYWDYNNGPTDSQYGEAATYNPNPFVGAQLNEVSENKLLTKVFGWMGIGLGISAACALGGYQFLGESMYGLFIPLAIIELILVFVLTLGLKKMSAAVATICFIAYSAINGLTLSAIFFGYELGSIYSTFFIAAAVFGIAAFYGKVTKKSLASWGTALMVGLIGIIIASIVNIFIGNSMLDFGISVIGIIIFIGLTAYDVNRIRDMWVEQGSEDSATVRKIAIWGALQIYLDFINIFLKLLRLFGRRRN